MSSRAPPREAGDGQVEYALAIGVVACFVLVVLVSVPVGDVVETALEALGNLPGI
jgi:hypothetical protein